MPPIERGLVYVGYEVRCCHENCYHAAELPVATKFKAEQEAIKLGWVKRSGGRWFCPKDHEEVVA